MGEKTFEPTNDEFNMAFNGSLMRAREHGLDTTDPKVLAFLLHNAEFTACLFAESRFLQNQIDGDTFND